MYSMLLLMRTLIILHSKEGVRIGIADSPSRALLMAQSQDPQQIRLLIVKDDVYGIMLSIPPGGLAFLPDETAHISQS